MCVFKQKKDKTSEPPTGTTESIIELLKLDQHKNENKRKFLYFTKRLLKKKGKK